MSASLHFKAGRLSGMIYLSCRYLTNEDEARRHCALPWLQLSRLIATDGDAHGSNPRVLQRPGGVRPVGGCSRSTLNRWLADGKIKRVPGSASL